MSVYDAVQFECFDSCKIHNQSLIDRQHQLKLNLPAYYTDLLRHVLLLSLPLPNIYFLHSVFAFCIDAREHIHGKRCVIGAKNKYRLTKIAVIDL